MMKAGSAALLIAIWFFVSTVQMKKSVKDTLFINYIL